MITIKYNGTVTIESDTPSMPSRAGVWVSATCDGFTSKSKGPNMAYTLANDKEIKVQVTYEDAKGNPAAVDGDVMWDTSDAEIAGVEVDPADSTKATVTPGDSLGNAQITATADADLGSGVTEIVCTMDLTVVAGTAVVGRITPVGEPTQLPS
jgi:hypothetical protein